MYYITVFRKMGASLFLKTTLTCCAPGTSQVALVVKNPSANARDIGNLDSISGLGSPLEEGMTTHSSNLAWRIPWTVEPGRLQSMGLQRVGHN